MIQYAIRSSDLAKRSRIAENKRLARHLMFLIYGSKLDARRPLEHANCTSLRDARARYEKFKNQK